MVQDQYEYDPYENYIYRTYDDGGTSKFIPYDDSQTICSSNAYNCESFTTWSDAQNVYMKCGGIDNDVHHLDGDGDGVACESLA